ncbi:MAG TPA: hypothetical protein VMS35_07990 [Nitrososphaeraceae archaeon]|nr:hypothetical protein [Nitrososphaeraceae archaeon]
MLSSFCDSLKPLSPLIPCGPAGINVLSCIGRVWQLSSELK